MSINMDLKAAHVVAIRCQSEVFGCIPHGARAYRERDSFAMWAGHHGVTVSMTTVSISSDPFALSKRLIEEYKHKEAVSKTYEGLSKQKQISALTDEKISRELQARLLYNTVMLSEKNPGELIKNYNRPDNPLLDVLNSGYELSESLNKLAAFPGMERIIKAINERKMKADEIVGEAIDANHE